MLLTSRRRFPCYICLNQILDFGKVHLDLRISKKLMPTEHQTTFQNFYSYSKIFHVFRTHGPILRRSAFRKFRKRGAGTYYLDILLLYYYFIYGFILLYFEGTNADGAPNNVLKFLFYCNEIQYF